jgi:hypothetical protein
VASPSSGAFQANAFQNNAFQIVEPILEEPAPERLLKNEVRRIMTLKREIN